MTMTSRERVEAALQHRAPDRTPVFEYVLLSPVADHLVGRPYANDPQHWEALRHELGWEDKRFGRLQKAEKADRYLFTAQTRSGSRELAASLVTLNSERTETPDAAIRAR